MPSFLAWAQNLSWFYYGFDLLMRNQWSEIKHLNCSSAPTMPNVTSLPMITYPSTTSISLSEVAVTTPSATTAKPNFPKGICLPDGQGVIEFLDMGNHNEASNWAALVIIFLVLRVGGYISLYVRAKFTR